jgi:L-lactate dehydrogenase complex protein LldF
MNDNHATFAQRIHEAIEDDYLINAVKYTTERLKSKKLEAASELGGWEEWREKGRQIREHTISHLDHYLRQFVDNARQAGVQVYFAKDAQEAAQITVDIAKKKQAKRVVKSKSMVSEEIHINHELEAQGIQAIETDLGEYIIQLAKETPSHIIIPAIHKTRKQIQALFEEAGGVGLTTETKNLTAFARKTLRAEFLQADVGITGCNFAIAQTGSIVLFTNEGNGRMVTTFPKTHIVLMGMERILPTIADLEVMATLLPRSATGQKLTAYMTVLTGPRRVDEQDGAEEMHLIIVDNGRSKQLGDPKFQTILHCIRCGACLNVCPVYRHIGGHAYGSVYPGPIGAVLTPLLDDTGKHADLPYASSLCGACYEACPVKIPLHDLLVYLRQRNVAAGKAKGLERAAFAGYRHAFSSAKRYRFVLKMGQTLQGLITENGHFRASFAPLHAWTDSRDLPALPNETFRERFDKRTKGQGIVPSSPEGR